MEVCTQNFPLICISTGHSSAVAGARGGEKTATLFSPPFLAPDWSGARQSPRTQAVEFLPEGAGCEGAQAGAAGDRGSKGWLASPSEP